MNKLITITMMTIALLGCSKDLQTVELPPEAVVISGSIVFAKVEDGLRLKVTEIGGINPENCYLGFSSQLDSALKRNFIKTTSIACGEDSREFKGFAVGNDTYHGLRVNPEDNSIISEDESFSILVTETLPLEGVSLQYYGDDSPIHFAIKSN